MFLPLAFGYPRRPRTVGIALGCARCNGIALCTKLNSPAIDLLLKLLLSHYLPCPLYAFCLAAFGFLDLLCLPSLRLPKLILATGVLPVFAFFMLKYRLLSLTFVILYER